ncbi:hypothetical protein F383_32854 [Gossypium arboreum]|uniref:Uncharacterized protein n=1 Tax=Gossypium arboreum TaxID=29729 RepID=A0A0B0PPK9_GOSAR|nr:hypothetical protein F383_32854 [Gossypium arboreum]
MLSKTTSGTLASICDFE